MEFVDRLLCMVIVYNVSRVVAYRVNMLNMVIVYMVIGCMVLMHMVSMMIMMYVGDMMYMADMICMMQWRRNQVVVD